MTGPGRPLPTPDAEALRASVRGYSARRLDEATRSGSGCCPPAATYVVFEAPSSALPSFGCGDAFSATLCVRHPVAGRGPRVR